jgi:hypothetical protein
MEYKDGQLLRPDWCTHGNCIYKLSSQNKMCLGELPNIEPHDDDFDSQWHDDSKKRPPVKPSSEFA